jgi:glycosyltransferase involved in cell wall biosynthesis
MTSNITVCIATIPPRRELLRRAVASVLGQDLRPDAIIVETDVQRLGAASTKNRALAKVTTKYVAFLDDDDEFLPQHLAQCHGHMLSTGADVVYPWPEMRGMADPSPQHFGVPFSAEALRRYSYIPTPSLVNTAMAQAVGGFQHGPNGLYDDWGFYLALLDEHASFSHLPERTWIWHVHGQNTSGRPTW